MADNKSQTPINKPAPANVPATEKPNTENVNPGNNVSAPEVEEKFKLPANPDDLKLSDPTIQILGQRVLHFLTDIKGIDEKLKAQQEGDSSVAILAYADSEESPAHVKKILAEYERVEKMLQKAFDDLATVVKKEKGDVELSEEQITKLKENRAKYVEATKNALKYFNTHIETNEVEKSDKLFVNTISGMVGRRGSGAKTSGDTSYSQSTEVRPRLGDGYIRINDEKFKSFTPAVKQLQKISGNKKITVGQIHEAWAKAAGFGTPDKWDNCTRGNVSSFKIDNVDVEVKFDYQKPSAA